MTHEERIADLEKENRTLRKEAEHYRSLFMNAPLGLFRSTFDGRFLEVNSTLALLLGYQTPKEVLEQIQSISDQIYVRSEDRREILHQQADSRQICQYTNHYRRRDGSTFVANLYLRTIHDAEGTPLFLEGIIEDITEKRSLELKLAESEKLHRLTVENISDTVLVTRDDGSFTYVCPNTHFIFGLTSAQVLALESISALFPDDLFDQKELAEVHEIKNIEQRIWDASGKEHHLLINVKKVAINEGSILYTCRDISNLRRLENTLDSTKKQMDTLLNVLPQFVAYLDRNLTFQYANKTYEQAFGISAEDILDKPLIDVIGPKAFKKAKPHIEKVLKGERVKYQEHFDYGDAGTRDIEGTLIPEFSENGDIAGYFAILTDISDYIGAQKTLRHHASKLEEMNAALNILIEHRDDKMEKRETEIMEDFKKLVFPYLEMPLENKKRAETQLILDILRKNIQEIIAKEKRTIHSLFAPFTPLEAQVANLIRDGKTTKDIATILTLSVRTVYFHRDNIRKKLNLANQKINLKTFLQSL